LTSIRDIAKRTHVSIGTVDRVLHERGRVSAKTRARVRQIVEELDYRPNIYARNLSLAKTYTFGVLMPKLSQDSNYWRLPARGILRAAEEIKPYRVRVHQVYFDRYSEASFERAARKCKEAEYDGLLIAPVLPRIAGTLIPGLFRQVPHVFFDSTIPDSHLLSSVVQDPYQSGILAGGLMRVMLGQGGRVVMIKVLPDDVHINERMRGFEAGVRRNPRLSLTTEETDSREFGRLWRRLAKYSRGRKGEALGYFVTNAWTHAIARNVSRQRSAREKIRMIGYDLVAGNVKCLKEGSIDFLISQRPAMQGYLGIMALYRHVVLRERVKKQIMVPLDVLTRDNLTYYQD
jgi:LacI family transcriptional regulator